MKRIIFFRRRFDRLVRAAPVAFRDAEIVPCLWGDFSQVKICGASESSFEFADAFQKINMLLLSVTTK